MSTGPVASSIGYLLIVAFVIDRMVSGLLFMLSFWRFYPDPQRVTEPVEKVRAENTQRLIYFGTSTLIAVLLILSRWVPVVAIGDNDLFARLLTVLVLVGGAERLGAVSNLLNSATGQNKEPEVPQPIQITGKLTLEEGVLRIRRGAGRDGD